MMTPDERLSEIERLVNTQPPGPNDRAVRQISQQVYALRHDVKGHYGSAKLDAIQG